MNRERRIRALLTEAFQPKALKIVDDSHRHAGHAGAKPEGETHYRVMIVSETFEGKTRVERQRAVNTALKSEFNSGLHALQLSVHAISEV